jgi:hypothetical protein
MDHPEEETKPDAAPFDLDAFPPDTLFHERREGRERRRKGFRDEASPDQPIRRPPPERRAKKERRRRIDPTTFEKQYTEDEMEFMNAMQRYKVQSGKAFPSHGDVLRVAHELGYRRLIDDNAREIPGDGALAESLAVENGNQAKQ